MVDGGPGAGAAQVDDVGPHGARAREMRTEDSIWLSVLRDGRVPAGTLDERETVTSRVERSRTPVARKRAAHVLRRRPLRDDVRGRGGTHRKRRRDPCGRWPRGLGEQLLAVCARGVATLVLDCPRGGSGRLRLLARAVEPAFDVVVARS